MDKMERKEMKTNEPGERRTAGNGADSFSCPTLIREVLL